jgi:hypothetical protein
MFMLGPDTLSDDLVHEAPAELTVEDNRDDYGLEDGDGVWVNHWLDCLCHFYNDMTGERIGHDHDGVIDQDVFDIFTLQHIRNLLIRFTNAHYVQWREQRVHTPDLGDVESEQIDNYCDGCDNEGVWEEEWDETNKPIDPDEFDDYEEVPAGASLEVREAIERRNEALMNELHRAWSHWVDIRVSLGRTNICDDRCDGFWDSCHDRMADRTNCDIDWVHNRWEAFAVRRVAAPPVPRPRDDTLIPLPRIEIPEIVHNPLPSMSAIVARARRMRRGW